MAPHSPPCWAWTKSISSKKKCDIVLEELSVEGRQAAVDAARAAVGEAAAGKATIDVNRLASAAKAGLVRMEKKRIVEETLSILRRSTVPAGPVTGDDRRTYRAWHAEERDEIARNLNEKTHRNNDKIALR